MKLEDSDAVRARMCTYRYLKGTFPTPQETLVFSFLTHAPSRRHYCADLQHLTFELHIREIVRFALRCVWASSAHRDVCETDICCCLEQEAEVLLVGSNER